MRRLITVFLCFIPLLAHAEDKSFRFGLIGSMNSYKSYDPVAKTDSANALGFGGIVTMALDRESRALLNINHDSYSLTGSQTNVGEDISSFGGSLSYQKMMRFTRTLKPWFGVGLGYASTSHSNRYTVSTLSSGHTLYADYKSTDISAVLSANSEWEYSRDLDIGLQAQYAKTFSNQSSVIRVGIYFLY